MRELFGRLIDKARGYRTYMGAILPPAYLTPCGHLTDSPRKLYESALLEADRVVSIGGTPCLRVLDVGSGAGRLAVGLLARQANVARYEGIDVDRARIEWCKAHLARRDTRYSFRFLDVRNERYNPGGRPFQEGVRLADGRFDVVYLYSVFTHMRPADIEGYMVQFRDLLVSGGMLFATFFSEDDVPDCVENPENYGPLDWTGPLHCVLYSNGYVESLLSRHGFVVERTERRLNADGQTGWYARRV